MSFRHLSAVKTLNGKSGLRDRIRLTSSNIVRGMRIIWRLSSSSSLSNNSDTDASFDGPNAKIYSLESMTKSKFFFPDSFSCLSEFFYDVFLAHLENGRRIFSNYFSYLIQMFFCFLGLFHFLSPYIKITMKQERCQGVVR